MTPDATPELIKELYEKLDGKDGLTAQIEQAAESNSNLSDGECHTNERELKQLKDDEYKTAQRLAKALEAEISKLDGWLAQELRGSVKVLLLHDKNDNELTSRSNLSECTSVSLQDESFLDTARKLDSIVSYRHIIEEMDSRTYLERINGEFNRLKRVGKQLQVAVTESIGKIEELRNEWVIRVKPLIIANEACQRRKIAVEGSDLLNETSPELLAISNILELYKERLELPFGQFTSARNRDYIRDVTDHAAMVAERVLLPSVLAGINAIIAVLLLRYIITNSGSLLLLENQNYLIATVAPVAYFGALWLGTKSRKRRIDQLNMNMMAAFRSVFNIEVPRPKSGVAMSALRGVIGKILNIVNYVKGMTSNFTQLGFLFPSGNGATKEIFAFPKISLDRHLDLPKLSYASSTGNAHHQIFAESAGDVSKKDVSERWQVGRRSLLLAVVPPLLVALPGLTSGDPTSYLIGRTVDGERCSLAAGQIVRITPTDLHIAPADVANAGLIDRIFPTYIARTIDRGTIVEIRPASADLESCDRLAADVRSASAGGNNIKVSLLKNLGRYMRVSHNQQKPALDETSRRQIEAIHTLVTALQDKPSINMLSLYTDDRHIDGGPRANSMLFPLFREPVDNIRPLTKERVYEWGRRSLDLKSEIR